MLSFGKKFQCCFCQEKFRKFEPFGVNVPVFKEKKIIGGGFRKNALCPNCKSLDRERHVFLYLENKTNVLTDSLKLLHIAPERNLRLVFQKCKNLDYVTADLVKKDVMFKMDVTNIQFENNSFDVIICNHVLEHIVDDKKALCELYRILKPKGFAILQTPISFIMQETYENANATTHEQREREFGQYDHVRIYGRDYPKKIKSVGFNVETYTFVDDEGEELSKKYGLIEDEKIFICKKL